MILGFLVACSPALAQEPAPEAAPGPAPEAAPGPAPEAAPGEAPPTAEGTPALEASQPAAKKTPRGAGPTAGVLQLRLVWQDQRLPLRAHHVKGDEQPVGTSQANGRTGYDVRHTSARVELAYGLDLDEDVGLELYGGMGWGTTALSVEARTGSVVAGGGPRVEATMESLVDLDLALGFEARFDLTETIFVGGGYQFLYSRTRFDDQTFYSVVDGRYDLLVHDLTLRVGVRPLEVLSVWGGLGFTVTWSNLNLDEQGDTTRWDLNLETGHEFFKGVLGLSLHPGEHLAAAFEVAFIPDPSYRIQLGWTF